MHTFFWHGYQECVLETFGHPCGFFCALPLLEEGGETVHVESVCTRGVCDGDCAVALKGKAVHVGASAVPAFLGLHPVQIDSLGVVVPGKDVVEP